MKALVWRGGAEIELEEVPDPVPVDDEVVIEVQLAGICGSDLHAYRGHAGPRKPPVLGHEVVGEAEGSSYTVYPLIGCGRCERCLVGEENLCSAWRLIGVHRAGVFAERVVVPRQSLYPIPVGMDPRHAVLAEPLACGVGALAPHRITGGSRVVVYGCGPIGLLTVYLAARERAHVTAVDPVAERLAVAERLGATCVATDLTELELGAASLVVDAAGFASTWRAAIDAVIPGGEIVVLGLGQAEGPIPMSTLVRRSIALRGQFAYSRANFARAVEILNEGDLDRSWLSTAALADGAGAFADLVTRPAEFVKVLLVPGA